MGRYTGLVLESGVSERGSYTDVVMLLIDSFKQVVDRFCLFIGM